MNEDVYYKLNRMNTMRRLLEAGNGKGDIREQIEIAVPNMDIDEKMYLCGLVEGRGIGVRCQNT